MQDTQKHTQPAEPSFDEILDLAPYVSFLTVYTTEKQNNTPKAGPGDHLKNKSDTAPSI